MDWTFTIANLRFGIFDIITVAIVFISGISGFALGFSRFAFKLIGYVLSFPVALLFVNPLYSFLSSYIKIPQIWLTLICYVILCVVIFSLFKLLGNLLSTTFETLSLGWIDSLLGFIVAAIISIFVLFVLLELCSLQTAYDLTPLKASSFFYTKIFINLFPTMGEAFKGALSGL